MVRFLILILIVIASNINAQQKKYDVKITIKGFDNKMLYFYKFQDLMPEVIDTLFSDNNGNVFIDMHGKDVGMYRITGIDKNKFDFIFNNEPIEINSSYDNFNDNINVIASKENQVYYDLLKQDKLFQNRIDILNQLLYYYPKNTDFYKNIKLEYITVQNERKNYLAKTIQDNNQLYVAKIIQINNNPFLDPELNPLERLKQSKEKFLDNIDFSDKNLYASNGITNKILSYFSLYNESDYKKDQLEDSLLVAVNNVFSKVQHNQYAINSIAKYFSFLFDDYGFNKILKYIYEYYLNDDVCDDVKRKIDTKLRYEAFNKMTTGVKIEDFSFVDINGNNYKFSETKYDFNLILFWSSECSHCNKLIDELKKIYSSQKEKEFEIVAISLDLSQKNYKKFIKDKDIKWINYVDFKGWDNELAKKFYIYSTPSMYIVNKEGIIIAKTNKIEDIKNIIKTENH
ncbi:MAG: hypothetical protein A2X12_07635 [Bacteroidetes bacterium GWE2_29_8]|nr:MAG: hypothetical protein A2X12_07635 [Bacteroidetes bacterium GWE2_29_8]OFY22734.1 MAG: hypothetical protein A2X02_02150 [Bacteroidetes bacterium GWF2_29_10]